MIAELLTYPVDSKVVNTGTASTLLTGLIIITSAFTTAGLSVILRAGKLWIELPLNCALVQAPQMYGGETK